MIEQPSLFGAPETIAEPTPVQPMTATNLSGGEVVVRAECIAEIRYHTGRLAVPVGPVTLVKRGRMVEIQVDRHTMYTVDAVDQKWKLDRYIREIGS